MPAPGAYDVVFDSPTAAGAGAFSFRFWLDDKTPPRVRLVRGRLRIPVGALRPGSHSVTVQASDFQETKNDENVSAILPNTSRLTATFTVRAG